MAAHAGNPRGSRYEQELARIVQARKLQKEKDVTKKEARNYFHEGSSFVKKAFYNTIGIWLGPLLKVLVLAVYAFACPILIFLYYLIYVPGSWEYFFGR